ncbi:hypothetical protein [Streptomyces sp. NPDC058084]|uniref:hypothetical protein n=1 Tax=Streptomyces sp. NPDC058084 TaxID=3346333 RepID=UPI0036EC9E78
MMTRIARGLVGAALVTALAMTVGCGGGGGDGGSDDPTDSSAAPTTDGATDSDATALFPGGGGQAAPVHVPTAKVQETKHVKVKVRNGTGKPTDLGPPTAQPDDPQTLTAAAGPGTCTGTLAPDDECVLDLEVTPLEAGSYSGELTVETSEGETLTVPFSGEAVEGDSTDTVSPSETDTPLPTGPTETETVPTETTPTPEVT